MKGSTDQVALVAMLAVLAGCEATSSLTTAQPGATVEVKAAEILFFAPAMFFNLREVFRYHKFDLEQRVVRYKDRNDKEWHTYTPIQAEVVRAKAYFEGRVPAAGSRD